MTGVKAIDHDGTRWVFRCCAAECSRWSHGDPGDRLEDLKAQAREQRWAVICFSGGDPPDVVACPDHASIPEVAKIVEP